MYAHMELGGKQADGYPSQLLIGRVLAIGNEFPERCRPITGIDREDQACERSQWVRVNFVAPRTNRPGRSSRRWIRFQQECDGFSLVCFGIPGR